MKQILIFILLLFLTALVFLTFLFKWLIGGIILIFLASVALIVSLWAFSKELAK
jgi:hypothetical protein